MSCVDNYVFMPYDIISCTFIFFTYGEVLYETIQSLSMGNRQCYSRIAPGTFVPEFLPERGSVFNSEHAGAESARQRAAAGAGCHAGGHAVLRGRALGDEGDAGARASQPLRLGP